MDLGDAGSVRPMRSRSLGVLPGAGVGSRPMRERFAALLGAGLQLRDRQLEPN